VTAPSLDIALLDAQEALDRPAIRADLERLLDAGLPLINAEGQPTRHDLCEVLLVLDKPGMVDWLRPRLARTVAHYDRGQP
jgi:hypothetical protein